MQTFEQLSSEPEPNLNTLNVGGLDIPLESDEEGRLSISVRALYALLEEGSHEGSVIDVRTEGEYNEEHIPGVPNQPMSVVSQKSLEEAAQKLEKGMKILICQSGERSANLTAFVPDYLSEGSECRIIGVSGGMNAWKEAGYETEKQSIH